MNAVEVVVLVEVTVITSLESNTFLDNYYTLFITIAVAPLRLIERWTAFDAFEDNELMRWA